MALLKEDIYDKVNVIGYNDHCVMTIHDVVEAVARIKPGKHGGYWVYLPIMLNLHATSFTFTSITCL